MLKLFLALALSAFAAEPAPSPIEQAQALALKKSRREACAVLREAIAALPPKTVNSKLHESLQHISKMFFTDKGQRNFEAGQSAMWENVDLALTQLQASLALEDGNVSVLTAIARAHLAKNDCGQALTALQTARTLNPLDSEAAVLELRALVCEQRYVEMRQNLKSMPTLDKWQEAFVQYIQARDHLQQKSWRKAFDVLAQVTKEHPAFPEAYFHLAKASAELEKNEHPWLEKYVSLCKAITARERKRFALEPRLCLNLKDAEHELASKSAEE